MSVRAQVPVGLGLTPEKAEHKQSHWSSLSLGKIWLVWLQAQFCNVLSPQVRLFRR